MPTNLHKAIASCTVLVVDDQPSNVQVLGGVLGKLGVEIIPAADGAQALRKIELRTPDLVLLDLMMPGMNGFEVCEHIRQRPDWADIPIIFLSAADDHGLIVRALESGGVDYVTKPFNHAELVSRVRTHLSLKIARDRLRRLATDKDELLGILAHDLRNGLGGVHMSTQVLLSRLSSAGPVDPKVAQLGDNILSSASKLLAFVKEFVANNRAEHGIALVLKPTPIVAIVRASASQHEEAAERKQIRIVMQLPEAELPAMADTEAVAHVLDNLLSNAVKFSPRGTTITVAVRREDDGRIACGVSDQGPGFSDEDKARMFRRYERLSAKPTAGEPSTGLGLSIVKRLVTEMGGELLCESAPGKGTTFTFKLAAADSNPSTPS